jgi:nicotinamidase-related amidase
MPAKNHDLHGNVPDTSDVVLLIVDMINDLEFVGGERLLDDAEAAARRIAELKRRAKSRGVPVVYANDNFGKWRSDFGAIIDHVIDDETRGAEIARLLKPDEDDYVVIKPKHSAFYSTTLDTLLVYLRAKTLILTGVAANICILFTANDAYMRDFNLVVPADCVASEESGDTEYALRQIREVLKADVSPSTSLDLAKLGARAALEENPA